MTLISFVTAKSPVKLILMQSNKPAWWTRVRPLPGGWKLRVAIAIVTAVSISVDLPGENIDLSTPRGWVSLLTPYLPLAALSFGVLPAAAAWFVAIFTLYAMGAEIYQMAQLIIPTFLTLCACTFMLPIRQALYFSAAALAMLPLQLLVNPEVAATMTVQAVIWSAAIAAGLALNIYRERHEASTREIQSLRERQQRIRHEERKTLAHELHDIVAHEVTIIAMQARRAGLVNDPEKTASILENIGDSAQKALNDLRSLVLILKDDSNDEEVTASTQIDGLLDTPETSGETTTAVGFFDDLRNVVEAVERAGFGVEFSVDGEVSRIPTTLRQALRRSIRELGSNVLKHADSEGPVEIRLVISDTHATIQVSNSVSAKKPVVSSHTGLEAMRTRCEVFGGSLENGAVAGRWTTRMSVPLAYSVAHQE